MGLQERSKWLPPRPPEILKVEVQGDDEDEESSKKKKVVTITVDRNEEEEKPYRGGFRDVRNGTTAWFFLQKFLPCWLLSDVWDVWGGQSFFWIGHLCLSEWFTDKYCR